MSYPPSSIRALWLALLVACSGSGPSRRPDPAPAPAPTTPPFPDWYQPGGVSTPGSRPAAGVAPAPARGRQRMRIGTNFWNLEWGIWDDVFRPDADFAPGSNPWRPEFLQEVAAY